MSKVQFKNGNDLIIHNVYGVGRNYIAHARELSNPLPSEPVIFMKSPDDVTQEKYITLPRNAGVIHHECELVLMIGKDGKDIPSDLASGYIAGYAVGIDITLRDIQNRLKSKGLPWTLSKRFDQGGPISLFHPHDGKSSLSGIKFSLSVNGEKRQNGCVKDMIFSPEIIISFLSRHFTLHRGDIIFTGTPEGVGELHPGDRAELFLENEKITEFQFT